jgi:D-alanyl-D-alanine carboxypeptidase
LLRRFWILPLALAGFQGAFALSAPALARAARHAAMILDANTGAVLHNEDGDEQRHPASLTKMMTLYLTFETIESGRLKMSDKITISQEAASQAPSKLELEPGEEILVSDAIRAVITKSANDVAVALAEKVGGSEKNFVALMNTRARDMGMTKTHFENASGLPNNAQVTSARDMITLGLRLQDDFPVHYQLFATRAFSYNGATHRNHNTMLNNFQGIDGIKTGYTSASGFNLVSSVHRNGRHLVAAVFGGSSAASRNGEMRNLLTRALTRASTEKTRKPAPSLIAKLKSVPKLAERPKPKDKPKIEVAQAAPPAAPAAAPQPKPVAAAKPAAAPVPALAPAAAAVASGKSAPEAPAPLAAAAETAPIAADPIDVASAAHASSGPTAPIDVFKVKKIMVAPRQGPKRPAPSADETTDMSPEDVISDATGADSVLVAPPASGPIKIASADAPGPADALAQAFAAADTPAQAETIIPKIAPTPVSTTARLPTPLDDKIAMLGARDAEPDAAPAVVSAPVVPVTASPKAILKPTFPPKPVAMAVAAAAPKRMIAPPAPVERGRAPSSLQAQAAQIAPAAPQRSAALEPAAASGRYEIQIGAFGTIDEAQKALTAAQSRAATALAGHASVTHPVQKAGRQVFRARFSGFDAQRAASTCTELHRTGIDCFVMTAE